MKLPDIAPHYLELRIPESEMDLHFDRIAHEIGVDYDSLNMSWITLYEGATYFRDQLLSKLMTLDQRPTSITHDSMAVESYGSETKSNHNPKITRFPSNPVETIYKKDVLVIEDMADTGFCLAKCVLPYVLTYEPESLWVAVMLTNNDRCEVPRGDLRIKYRGPNVNFYVAGDGLDAAKRYRKKVGIYEVVWEKSLLRSA